MRLMGATHTTKRPLLGDGPVTPGRRVTRGGRPPAPCARTASIAAELAALGVGPNLAVLMRLGRKMITVGQIVGNYRITATLGVGGMGTVFLAEHPVIG